MTVYLPPPNSSSHEWQLKRDAGMARAESHANAVEPDWSATAYDLLETFCNERRGCLFTSEDVRRWCELRGFLSPVPKAWGPVFLKAAKRELIVRQGFAIAKQRHGSPCPQWGVA